MTLIYGYAIPMIVCYIVWLGFYLYHKYVGITAFHEDYLFICAAIPLVNISAVVAIFLLFLFSLNTILLKYIKNLTK